MSKGRVVLVYPMQGFSGAYVRHAPLSLLYAAIDALKRGYTVDILDTRLCTEDWRARLDALMGPDVIAVGVSVMSGKPITNAVAIGRHVKAGSPTVPVVWGGPHATFHPETILDGEWSADYVVSGYGSRPFADLLDRIVTRASCDGIPGVYYRDGGTTVGTPADPSFEFVDWMDIPYHLIADYGPYGQLDHDKRIFSMYSAMGCPYKCSFCSSPAQYAPIPGKKWVPIEATVVVDHIQHVVDRFGANYIYFIDDDSFPSLKHVEAIIDEIGRRGLPVKLGFRGARINEIKRMSDDFLDKLAAAGTDILHIGAESGSDRILGILRKDCTAQDIVEANRKLARHPQITAAYNFIMGTPTETLDDLKQTRDLMLQLVADHPNCLVFPPNTFRPLPGTELYDVAKREWGYEMPSTLDAWANIEVEGDIDGPWYDAAMRRFRNLMLITSYFVDDKVARMTSGKTALTRFARVLNAVYRPIARFRLRHGLSRLLVEYWAYRVMLRLLTPRQNG